MPSKYEPPQFDFGLWPPRISARGTIAVVLAAAIAALLVITTARPF
jgi:chorismate synthase